MINPALAVVIGKGIGQSLAFAWLWVDGRLRKHYCGAPQIGLPSAHVEFYDRDFIRSLKLEAA